MPQTTRSLDGLEIIGYADERDESMRPAIVPPVFRSRSKPGIVLVPPFNIHFECVVGGTEIPYAEAEYLHDRQELTFFSKPYPAQHGHQLWLRRNGEDVYQPIAEARKELDQLSGEAIERAETALASGDLDAAELAASEAVLASDQRPEPYAIKAAIRSKRNKPAGVQLMRELAPPAVGLANFDRWFKLYVAIVPTLNQVPDLSRVNLCPMSLMATVPPKQLPA